VSEWKSIGQGWSWYPDWHFRQVIKGLRQRVKNNREREREESWQRGSGVRRGKGGAIVHVIGNQGQKVFFFFFSFIPLEIDIFIMTTFVKRVPINLVYG